MSLQQYFGEQGDEHKGRLFWSNAIDGIPFRGTSVPLATQEELDTGVDTAADFHVEEFDLTKLEQREKYVWVMNRVANGWFTLYRELCPTPMTRVLEWLQRYHELSPTLKDSLLKEPPNAYPSY
jgi:hypothetical protein